MATEKIAGFFSYSRADSDFVVRLAADLKAAGANVWLDQLDIVPGHRWDRAIEDALKSCPRLMVILSPTSVQSTNVMDEVSFALEEQKTVIPIVYKGCEIPFRLRRLQYVDFQHDYGHALTELLKVLHPEREAEQRIPPRLPVREHVSSIFPDSKARQADVQAARRDVRAQIMAPEAKPASVSKFPMAARIAAGMFALVVLGFLLFWKFRPTASTQQSEGTQKSQPQAQPVVIPPATQQQPAEAQKTIVEVQAANTSPVEPTKPKIPKSDAKVVPKNNPADAFEQAKLALRAGQFDKAVQGFQLAAAGGDARAMNNLADLYMDGRGVAKDYRQALAWYQKGADAGNGAAMANLGHLYEQGLGVAKDYQLARQWYKKGANAGNGHAMDGMGVLYHNGEGVARDYQVARQWYEKAIAAGDVHAMSNLAVLYADGLGVAKDYDQARQLNEKAAAAGDVRAFDNLGILYTNGFGVPKDYQQARQWFDKGAAAGGAHAMTHLGNLYQKGLGVPQDYQQARQWYEKGAAAGNAQAMTHLGEMYEVGLGVSKNLQLARQWYEKGAAAGDDLARKKLQGGQKKP
jgi:TPR repeat protein